MKFSIQLPTCTEGLVNPIPFIEPEKFITIAQEAERLGYDAVWGNDHITPAPYVKKNGLTRPIFSRSSSPWRRLGPTPVGSDSGPPSWYYPSATLSSLQNR